jgi:hypothetical protein
MEDKVEIKSNFEKEIVPNITGFRKIDLEEDDEHKTKRDKKELSDEDSES